MQSGLLSTLRGLSDADLIARIQGLVGREREVVAELIAHLAELDTRDAHLRMGYGSLYVYCRDALSLSEAEAYTRIEVARTVRRFPIVLEVLFDGALSLTAARLLAPHLTAENHRRVLESARGKRKAEVEEIVAALAPRPDPGLSCARSPTPRLGSRRRRCRRRLTPQRPRPLPRTRHETSSGTPRPWRTCPHLRNCR